MGPLYQHEKEVASKMAHLFDEAADGIGIVVDYFLISLFYFDLWKLNPTKLFQPFEVEMTSADYDFKILKELRADYQGEEEESKEVKETKDKEQEKLIEGNFYTATFVSTLLLDDLMLLDIDEPSDLDLLTDFEKTDDLLSFDQDMGQPAANSFQKDLIDIFEAQNQQHDEDHPC